MPGNLEALLILPEHASGVKKKLAGNPYGTTVSGQADRGKAGVKGDPKGRRSEPLTPAHASQPIQPTMDNGPGPAGALRDREHHQEATVTKRRCNRIDPWPAPTVWR